jgi:putative acetyltransferase
MTTSPSPRLLSIAEAASAAHVHRLSFDTRFPWLAGLHTPDEDARFYKEHVFQDCAVWGIHYGAELAGFIAFKTGWVEQLYVLPAHQGLGFGGSLLNIAKSQNTELQLWTFQKNTAARVFYEGQGFTAIEYTDGSANEEREPDVRLRWVRAEQ